MKIEGFFGKLISWKEINFDAMDRLDKLTKHSDRPSLYNKSFEESTHFFKIRFRDFK